MSLPKKFMKVAGGTTKSKMRGSEDDILPVLTGARVKKMRESIALEKKKKTTKKKNISN